MAEIKSQKIVPNLWFDKEAEEAAKFYVSVFKDSKINQIDYYNESGAKVSGKPVGSVMTVSFQIEGQDFIALNGGPEFKFTHAISFMVNCKNQEEIDRLWVALTDGGEEEPCGWLKDKYGVSWQIVPEGFEKMMKEKDKKKKEKMMEAFFNMKKIDIDALEKAGG